MEDKLNELLTVLLSAVEKGMDLAAAEIPLVIKELLNWIAIENLIMFGIHIVVAVSVGFTASYFFKLTKKIAKQKHYSDASFFTFLGAIGSIVTAVAVGLLGVTDHLIPAIRVWVAPRLVLIDYIKEMIQ